MPELESIKADLENVESKIDYHVLSEKPHEDTIYMTIPYAKVTDAMVKSACETSRDTLRHTVEGTDLVVLKWAEGAWKYMQKIPVALDNVKSDAEFKIFTYEQILVELQKPEWQSDIEDII